MLEFPLLGRALQAGLTLALPWRRAAVPIGGRRQSRWAYQAGILLPPALPVFSGPGFLPCLAILLLGAFLLSRPAAARAQDESAAGPPAPPSPSAGQVEAYPGTQAGRPASAGMPAGRQADGMAQRVQACTACHGKQGRATNDAYFPRIAGKPAGYLYNQLIHFREGRRTYPLMTYLLEHLSDDYLLEMAQHFAAQQPPYPPPPQVAVSASVLERGRALVVQGDAGKQVPACIACHGERLTGVAPNIPGLLGLPRDYLNAQFGAWKNGNRHAAQPDCMAQIAARLSVADISAASAWLATRPVPADPAPATQGAGFSLPMDCGSVPLPATGSPP